MAFCLGEHVKVASKSPLLVAEGFPFSAFSTNFSRMIDGAQTRELPDHNPTGPTRIILGGGRNVGAGGLGKVLGSESQCDCSRHVLWDATGWHRDYSPPAWRNRATEEQKRIGWEMAVRIERILCPVLHEAHRRQVEETMKTLEERPERFYESLPD